MGSMFSSPETPKMPQLAESPDLSAMYNQLFTTQKNFLPKRYQAEKSWGPLFNQLELANQKELAPKYQQLIMDLQKQFAPQALDWQMQLQKEYLPQLMAQQQEQQNAARMQELETIQKFGPQLKSAIENINPQETKLKQLLGDRATSEFQLGSQLDPQGARDMQQAVRMGQTARGMTQGQAPLSEEARITYEQGQNMKNQRTQNAFNYLALPQFNALQALNLGQGAYSQGQQVLGGAAQQGTQGMGMVPSRGSSLIDMSGLGQAFGQESQNVANQNQMAMQQWGAMNSNAQNQGSPWMNLLPMAGMAGAMGLSALFPPAAPAALGAVAPGMAGGLSGTTAGVGGFLPQVGPGIALGAV